MKRALVLGGSGFIGSALTHRLQMEGTWVTVIDIREPRFEHPDEFFRFDLRQPVVHAGGYDEVYQLAADLGGAGYIYPGGRDAEIMANNVAINRNVAKAFSHGLCGRLLFTSSACVYPQNQQWLLEGVEGTPGTAYGWEKLFAEKLYEAHRARGLNVCIARLGTVYGPVCAYEGGREQAVAALCRKAIDAPEGGELEVWGDGRQQRSLVYVDDVVEALIALARSKDFDGPVNISEPFTTECDAIARCAMALSGKQLRIVHVPGPVGERASCMVTVLAKNKLGWKATMSLSIGMARTFKWIAEQKARPAA